MEGLIKGLIDVALGVGDNNDDESNSQARDERSRSTWAQVVSGEQEQDQDEEGGSGRQDYNRNQWNRKEENEWRNEEPETAGERPSRRHQKLDCEDERYKEGGKHQINQHQWNRKEHDEGSNEDWETVGKRPPRQPHKEHDGGSNEDWETVGKRPPRQSHKEHNEGSNEDWETVGKRPPRQPHKVPMDYWHGYKQHPSEQKYADDISYGAEIEPSEKELSDLSHACNKLWELDSNCLVPGRDYQIDCGEGKKVYQKEDMAQGSLFDWVNEEIFRKPTYSRFCSLLDNYNPNEGSKEVVTSQEKHEQVAFIEEISRTAPIKYLHKYLLFKGIISEDIHDFKRMLTDLWFELYGRGGTSGSSSAFEHVFVGEIKNHYGEHEVSGFHNWIQFYLEESKGRVDYQGYIFPRRRGQMPDSETKLLTVQFEWNGVLKSVSSTLVGVSPEFEIALYTLCFYMGGEDNYIQLGPYPVNIKCYRHGNDRIGSAFPIAEC